MTRFFCFFFFIVVLFTFIALCYALHCTIRVLAGVCAGMNITRNSMTRSVALFILISQSLFCRSRISVDEI